MVGQQLCVHLVRLQSRAVITIPGRYARFHQQTVKLTLQVFGSLVG